MLKKFLSLFKSQAPTKDFVPRATRVQVIPIHGVTLKILSGENSDKTLALSNISASGLGANPHQGMPLPRKGELLQATVLFPSARYPVKIRIAHSSELAMGCAFIEEFSILKNEILHYFNVELAAKELVEVNSDILKGEPDGAPRLFRGRNNCELFLVEHEGKIVRFQLSFFGNYIEGGEGLKTKLGFLSSTQNEKPKYKGSSIVRLVSELSPEIIHNAMKFVDNIKMLSTEQREIICIAIRHGG